MTKVIIIGAGVAGLSAGSFLQMNGYETEIFEMHDKPGGLCASWNRKGYHIDGCVHWWYCTSINDPIYPTLDALLDMKNFPRVIYDEFCSVEEDGKILHFFSNLDSFEKELKTISPEDSKTIEEMIDGARKIASTYIHSDRDKEFYKWKVSIGEYLKKIKSSLIKKLLTNFPFSPNSSMYEFLLLAARLHNKDACYPIGGAQKLANRLAQRYTLLGGTINYNSNVDKILTENDSAIGIQLNNGNKYNADYVISAADGYSTIRKMLKGQYVDENIKKLYYSNRYIPQYSQIYVSLGINRVFEDSFKPYVFINLKNPLIIEEEDVNSVGITIHNFDPTSAPLGKTVLTILIPIKYSESWINLRKKNREEYERKKEEIAFHMIEEIDAYFGDIKTKVEMVDVATPATYIRYTNNWNSGVDSMTWGSDVRWETNGALIVNKPKKEITGLNNFFMCGQWVGDPGLSEGMQSGKDAALILCKSEGKQFKVIKNNN
ncbi:MAG: phytoene desaturase family protein [Candidatus Thorarchaeota archaeon]